LGVLGQPSSESILEDLLAIFVQLRAHLVRRRRCLQVFAGSRTCKGAC
jgi:hypothetical protein